MADDLEGGGGKIPKWVYIAAGGGVLIILLMGNKNNKSSIATDNLLAAEMDAMLKATQEALQQQQEEYKKQQQEAWLEFMQSIEELMGIRQGGVEPPSSGSGYGTDPQYIPHGSYNPPTPPPDGGSGSEVLATIPDVIPAGMNDNFVMGFNYKKSKGGNHG